MSVLCQIFVMFAKLSMFSFGGGYVMFPILMKEIEQNRLISMNELSDVIAIAGMSPGAVAVNAAVGVGFRAAGIPGVIASFLGITLPCLIIVVVTATFFFKVYQQPLVKGALSGLRPVTTGIVLYAAVKLGCANGIFAAAEGSRIDGGWDILAGGTQLFEVKSVLIAAAAFIALVRAKIHPVLIILAAGVLGVFFF